MVEFSQTEIEQRIKEFDNLTSLNEYSRINEVKKTLKEILDREIKYNEVQDHSRADQINVLLSQIYNIENNAVEKSIEELMHPHITNIKKTDEYKLLKKHVDISAFKKDINELNEQIKNFEKAKKISFASKYGHLVEIPTALGVTTGLCLTVPILGFFAGMIMVSASIAAIGEDNYFKSVAIISSTQSPDSDRNKYKKEIINQKDQNVENLSKRVQLVKESSKKIYKKLLNVRIPYSGDTEKNKKLYSSLSSILGYLQKNINNANTHKTFVEGTKNFIECNRQDSIAYSQPKQLEYKE
jgi:hypothetical protein